MPVAVNCPVDLSTKSQAKHIVSAGAVAKNQVPLTETE